jgi:hypothetical protein
MIKSVLSLGNRLGRSSSVQRASSNTSPQTPRLFRQCSPVEDSSWSARRATTRCFGSYCTDRDTDLVKGRGRYGSLWGLSYENFSPSSRRLLEVSGSTATPNFLIHIVTDDLRYPPKPPRPETEGVTLGEKTTTSKDSDDDLKPVIDWRKQRQLRSACFLDSQGGIVSDALLWKLNDERYIIDVPANTAALLLSHLRQSLQRLFSSSSIIITDVTESISSHIVFGTLLSTGLPPFYVAALDPRHPSLGMYVLGLPPPVSAYISSSVPSLSDRIHQFELRLSKAFPLSPGTYDWYGVWPESPKGGKSWVARYTKPINNL